MEVMEKRQRTGENAQRELMKKNYKQKLRGKSN